LASLLITSIEARPLQHSYGRTTRIDLSLHYLQKPETAWLVDAADAAGCEALA